MRREIAGRFDIRGGRDPKGEKAWSFITVERSAPVPLQTNVFEIYGMFELMDVDIHNAVIKAVQLEASAYASLKLIPASCSDRVRILRR